MNRKTFLFTFIMMAAMSLAGCSAWKTAFAGSNTPTEEPTLISTETGAADQRVVTLADSGSTIQLKVGEGFLLKLGNEYTWDISISDQSVISLRKGVMVILGAQGIYDALKPGAVQLSATGDPQCRQSVPACAAPSIQFSVTIEVQ